MRIFVNARVCSSQVNGVNRYTTELQRRLNGHLTPVAPARALRGVKGHLWEQAVLPVKVRHGMLWSPANCGALAVRRQVLTVHDVASLDHPEWYSRAFATWYRWMTCRSVHRVQRVITVSEFSKWRLRAQTGLDESRITVIPGGVDQRFYPRPVEEVQRTRRSLNLPSHRYVLSLSTVEPRKNLRRVLAAWASCAKDLPSDVWLIIAGSRGPRQVFRDLDLGWGLPRVHVTGFVPDDHLPALYSGALAVVYASLYEGFGLPVLEGMACGAAPIAADNTALPEVVGDAGLLVDPFAVDAIAAAIKRLVQDSTLRGKVQRAAIRRSRQFTWDRAAAKTWSVLCAEALDAGTEPDNGDCWPTKGVRMSSEGSSVNHP